MARRIGEESILVGDIEYHTNKTIPESVIQRYQKFQYMTGACIKDLYNQIPGFCSTILYNDISFPIQVDLYHYSCPNKPYFGYTPDLVFRLPDNKMLGIEVKQNFGYVRLKGGSMAYINPELGNNKKRLVLGHCLKNKITFLELRRIKKEWYNTTAYFGKSKFGKDGIRFDVKNLIKNGMPDKKIIR